MEYTFIIPNGVVFIYIKTTVQEITPILESLHLTPVMCLGSNKPEYTINLN